MKWGLKGGISIYADSGPPRYVLWCCGCICHKVLTFIQIGCGHTVELDNALNFFCQITTLLSSVSWLFTFLNSVYCLHFQSQLTVYFTNNQFRNYKLYMMFLFSYELLTTYFHEFFKFQTLRRWRIGQCTQFFCQIAALHSSVRSSSKLLF